MPQPQVTTLVASFLKHLHFEEELLRTAIASLFDVHAALSRGDLAMVASTRSRQEQIALALQDAETTRFALARDVANALEIPPGERLTLTVIANHLPEPSATELLASRQQLSIVTTELGEIQGRNANLINSLRSYFRGVLSAFTGADTPGRYGSSGIRLAPGSGVAIQARG